MNWSAIAAICSLVAVVAVILGSVFTHGRLSKTVETHTDQLKEHDSRINSHSEKLNDIEIEQARVDEWRKGFSAAANIRGNP